MRLHRSIAPLAAAFALVLAAGAAAEGEPEPPPPDPVLLAVGDIAGCDWTGDDETSAILDLYPDVPVASLGDHVYEDGDQETFEDCFEPSWGRHKARLRPVPGNHEYHVSGAADYFEYFGAAAGTPGEGWYSYDIGAWHVIALNSNCGDISGCGAGSPQEVWLRQDLAAHQTTCTLAYWHHPRFTSGEHGGGGTLTDLWKALYEGDADLVLNGHEHDYERFAPQRWDGRLDPIRGLREFIVGTGGVEPRGFGSVQPNSEVRMTGTFGVLKLDLHATSYDWQFVPTAGGTFSDSGSQACDLPPDTTPPTVPTGLAAVVTGPNRVDLSWQAATDDWGVVGYDVYRNGILVASPSGAARTFADTNIAPLTSYSYRIEARDSSDNVSGLSDPATVTTPGVVRLAPTADARVQEANPTTNYGTSSLKTDAAPGIQSFLRFEVAGIVGTVLSARLRLYSSGGTANGPAVYETAAGWTESAVNWNNRPLPSGAATDDRGAIGNGVYVEWDVTPLVTGNGALGLALIQPGTDGVDFTAREGTPANRRPELIVTYSPGPPPPPDTSPPSKPEGLGASATTGRIDLSWQAATDNVGVSGYDLFRNGTLYAALGAVTSYADTSVSPNTTYSYTVRARDAAGNLSALSAPATATTPAAPTVVTLAPAADARVQEGNASTNYGTSSLRTDAGPAVESYLRFDLGVLPGQVQSAKLRLYVTAGTADGPAAYPTGASWAETALTWANRPARSGAASDDRASLPNNAYAEWDVTSLIPAGGAVGFVLAQTGTDGVDYNAKEASANRPQLVVTVVGDPPPPDLEDPSVPQSLSAVAATGRVDLAWSASTDNVGVSGYDLYRNGALYASLGAVTSYADTSVAPNTAYSYALRARDAAGNLSALSAPATATTPPTPVTLTFPATADGRVQEANPTTNYGTSGTLTSDAGPGVDSYLRFDLAGVGSNVQSARLRIWATTNTVDGPAVYPTGAGWAETALTWANRPSATGPAADDRVAIPSGSWVEWNVTSLVTGNGPLGLLLAQTSTDGVDYSSREGGNVSQRPQLVVTFLP